MHYCTSSAYLESEHDVMNIEIFCDDTYKGRRLIIKHMSAGLMDWYCGYVQLLPTDLCQLKSGDYKDDLDLNPVFDDFYGGVTFLGNLQDKDFPGYYAGFDTAHPFMEKITFNDCLNALKKTADRLENL